jgi:hypothetical protein
MRGYLDGVRDVRAVPPERNVPRRIVLDGYTRYPATTIVFKAEPPGAGTEWRVIATFAAGQKEQIDGFRNEVEAVAWIGGPQCMAWLKARGYE